MPEQTRSSRARRIVPLVVALLLGFAGGVFFAQAGGTAWGTPCATAAVPAGGGPAPAGALLVPGLTPAPPGLTCAAGNTCTAAAAVCGPIWSRGVCTDTIVTSTFNCNCKCL